MTGVNPAVGSPGAGRCAVSVSRRSLPVFHLEPVVRVAHQISWAVRVQDGVRVDDSVANSSLADSQTRRLADSQTGLYWAVLGWGCAARSRHDKGVVSVVAAAPPR